MTGPIYVSKGITYAYDRASGERLTPPHEIGTPEWWAALQAIRAKAKPKVKEEPGTWGALVVSYRSSPRFLNDLAPRTRADYQAVLDHLGKLHDRPISAWTRGFVAGLRDEAQKKKGRRFANYVLSVVSVVFAHGIEREMASTNPERDVKKLRRPKGAPRANRPWSPEEWDAVVAAASPELRAAPSCWAAYSATGRAKPSQPSATPGTVPRARYRGSRQRAASR